MILDEVPDTAPWTVLSSDADATIYYAGAASIDLSSSGYRQLVATTSPTASRGSDCAMAL